MNEVNKKLLDELIERHRAVRDVDVRDTEAFRAATAECYDTAMEICRECETSWTMLDMLIHGVLGRFGMKPEASNEDIYDVFRILGWEVT